MICTNTQTSVTNLDPHEEVGLVVYETVASKPDSRFVRLGLTGESD